jgi:hypothetical protein
MSVVSGIVGARAIGSAADTAAGSNRETLVAQQDIYEQEIARQEPFYDVGIEALDSFRTQAGLGGDAGEAPPLSPLAQWETEQFNLSQGRADAARGLSGSGGAASRQARGEREIAAADYQNSYSRILDALKLGTGASAQMGGASGTFSGQLGTAGQNAQALAIAQGNATAQLYSGTSANTMQGIGLGLEAYEMYGGGSTPPPAYSGTYGPTQGVAADPSTYDLDYGI